MNNITTNPKEQVGEYGENETLKLTSLIYFEEALSKEAYEQCTELLKVIKELGVAPEEIQRLIKEHLDVLKARGRKVVATLRKP